MKTNSWSKLLSDVTLTKKSEIAQPSLPSILKKDLSKNSPKNAAFDFGELNPSEYVETSQINENGDAISIGQFSVSPSKAPRSVRSTSSPPKTVTIRSQSIDLYNFDEKSDSRKSKWHLFKNSLNKGSFQPKLPDIEPINRLKSKRYTVFDLNSSRGGDSVDTNVTSTQYEPTYRLGPTLKVDKIKAEQIIRDVLDNFIENMFTSEMMSLNSSIKSGLSHLTTTIKSRIKSIVDARHKIVVNTTISEQKSHGLIIASKCLWDPVNDFSITIQEHHKNYVFLVNLFIIYHE
jgi:hypothetical protein